MILSLARTVLVSPFALVKRSFSTLITKGGGKLNKAKALRPVLSLVKFQP
jgi:hypothetical protein